ncbi:MAG: trehalose-6-phosphate synthase [Xanthomonadales bacterium]|nr:trehalose-6-phosphate synthase [Xanthomonadales bacterium]
MAYEPTTTRLIVVSNRLPFVIRQAADGGWDAEPGSGGLVSALVPALKKRGGVWVGWPGVADADAAEVQPVLDELTRDVAYSVQTVGLTASEVDGFYFGFSNEAIWPLFHDFTCNCNFVPSYWRCYRQVNRKYARAVADIAEPGDFIWVQDYHLMQMGRELRELKLDNRIGFFLHIPFPPLDIFLRLPWRQQIIRGLLQFDLVGFQTARDRRNFLQCVRTLFEDIHVEKAGRISTVWPQAEPDNGPDPDTRRKVRVGSFPIGIDYASFAECAASERVDELVAYLQSTLDGRKLILGMDRMDYTKGILNRLEAFHLALQRYPKLFKRVRYVQHLVPSREGIDDYHELKNEVERLVSEINGDFTRAGWVPVHYIHRSMKFEEVVAYYRAADIALVTPLKDGMNLVAKEYCAARIDDDGVLVLSEFAGAAAQLKKDALLVNPYDIEATAEGIYKAFTMSAEERKARMHALRKIVRDSDVFDWVESFLDVALDRVPVRTGSIEASLPHADTG